MKYPEARKDIQAAVEEIRNYKRDTDQKLDEYMGDIKRAFIETQKDFASVVKVDNQMASWILDIRNQGLPNFYSALKKQINERMGQYGSLHSQRHRLCSQPP
jgi:signal recognition particle GTPase